MTTTINASTSTGLVSTADTSGIIKLQSNGVTTNALAWVNFNGTLSTPITPRANYNISSVTKNGTGDYTCNFTTALSDANYSVFASNGTDSSSNSTYRGANVLGGDTVPTTSAVRIGTWSASSGVNRTSQDVAYIYVGVFGN
jgi:hypothetical protein